MLRSVCRVRGPCADRNAAAKSEAKGVAPPRIFVARKPHWFEKFRWFVSSDGIIVVAGSDAQQNEQLVKKYMRPQVRWSVCTCAQGSAQHLSPPITVCGRITVFVCVRLSARCSQDIYVHAELHGAATCIVRNPSNKTTDVDIIPPTTIEQAGQFTVNPIARLGLGLADSAGAVG